MPPWRGAGDFFVAHRLYTLIMALLSCHMTEHKCVNVDPLSPYSDYVSNCVDFSFALSRSS